MRHNFFKKSTKRSNISFNFWFGSDYYKRDRYSLKKKGEKIICIYVVLGVWEYSKCKFKYLHSL